MTRLFPRNLSGQLALLVALALFVAQAINLGLVLRDRAEFRLGQATRPAAIRIADALERESSGRALVADHGRVRRRLMNPIPANYERHPEVVEELRAQLAELGLTASVIDAGILPEHLQSSAASKMRPHRRVRDRDQRPGDTLVIAVREASGSWIVTNAPWPRRDARIVWALVFQTLIIYALILLPVLWIARRISRPLRALADAARGYTPGQPLAVPTVEGPSDVRDVIAAFDALAHRVAAMLDEKDRMLGAIGHDLRTPLAALRVRIESVEDDDDRARMADTIDEMNRTLDDILSLARLGRPSEAPTDVDIAALVDAVVEDFRDLGRDVRYDPPARVRCTVRPTLFRRAVRNLIENAVKYAGSAEVAVHDDGRAVRICVADRGPGIPPDRLADVFDPFIRLETSRNRETGGIGLGLALARAIVREAGGDIALANRAGGGLEATVTLPR